MSIIRTGRTTSGKLKYALGKLGLNIRHYGNPVSMISIRWETRHGYGVSGKKDDKSMQSRQQAEQTILEIWNIQHNKDIDAGWDENAMRKYSICQPWAAVANEYNTWSTYGEIYIYNPPKPDEISINGGNDDDEEYIKISEYIIEKAKTVGKPQIKKYAINDILTPKVRKQIRSLGISVRANDDKVELNNERVNSDVGKLAWKMICEEHLEVRKKWWRIVRNEEAHKIYEWSPHRIEISIGERQYPNWVQGRELRMQFLTSVLKIVERISKLKSFA